MSIYPFDFDRLYSIFNKQLGNERNMTYSIILIHIHKCKGQRICPVDDIKYGFPLFHLIPIDIRDVRQFLIVFSPMQLRPIEGKSLSCFPCFTFNDNCGYGVMTFRKFISISHGYLRHQELSSLTSIPSKQRKSIPCSIRRR